MNRPQRGPATPPTGARRWLRARAQSAPWCRFRLMPVGVLSRPSVRCASWPWWRHEVWFYWVFSTSWGFLTAQPYRAFDEAASGGNEGFGSVAIGTAAAIVRANLPEPA